MKQQVFERVWHLGLSAALAASFSMLGACSNDTIDTGDRSEADAVAEKVFSPKSEAPAEAPSPEKIEAPAISQQNEVTPTAPPDEPAAAGQDRGSKLRERLKAAGWKEVKQSDGSILLMPPGSE